MTTSAHTIDRWISDRARTTPDRVAIDYDGSLVSYRELDEASDAFAAAFAAAGLRRGERVATLTGNSPDHVAVLFACAKTGLMLLPLSWRLTAAELRYQLEDAEPALFLAEAEYEELAAATGHPYERLERPRPGVRPRDLSPQDEDGLLLVYTSGTTGKPKGAVITHSNCFWTNLSFDLGSGVHADDVALQVLPQFHVGGWNVQALLAWLKGARVVLERQFEPARVLRLIEEKRVTTMMGVPPIYLFLAQEPGFADADLSSLQRAVVGGAPMPEPLLETWARRGTAIVQGYGLTEAAPNVLCLPPEDAVRRIGFAGRPYPFVEVRLSAEEELQVRGPNVFAGYWRNPEATAAAFTPDGWLRTGDVAECDDEGFHRIKGRLKDMYISGGENVYPAEVEAVLHEHPAVRDAAVVGMPDERWGEVGAAFVAADGIDEAEVLDWCRERLAKFKVPASVRFVAEVPRNSLGKIQKQGLLEEVPVSETVATGAGGRTLSRRGAATRQKLLDAAEKVFGDLGYHDASIVKITETAGVSQGTFYLYFASKKEVFDELVRDLNRRIRHAMTEASAGAKNRLEAELLGFGGYFEFTSQHPGLYKIIRQSAFVSPEMFRYHYDRVSEPYVAALQEAVARGEVGPIDPEVTAWALMAVGEMVGMRWIVSGDGSVPAAVEAELARIIRSVLEPPRPEPPE